MTDLAGQAVAGPGRSASRSGATIFRGSIGKNAEHPDHQIQRHRMHEQPEQICHEPVITQALATQVDLQFLVSVLTFLRRRKVRFFFKDWLYYFGFWFHPPIEQAAGIHISQQVDHSSTAIQKPVHRQQ